MRASKATRVLFKFTACHSHILPAVQASNKCELSFDLELEWTVVQISFSPQPSTAIKMAAIISLSGNY